MELDLNMGGEVVVITQCSIASNQTLNSKVWFC
jgi:hypothetical protein